MTLERSRGSLAQVAGTLTMRCDAKQTQTRFMELDVRLSKTRTTRLSTFLPEPLVKGKQPVYLEDPEGDDFCFVVSTLAVQSLRINAKDCRYSPAEFYESVGKSRQLADGDIVLTMDGGTSIGKVAVFSRDKFAKELDLEPEDLRVTVDSHVAILRPRGISPLALAYLLASPIGQLQFQRAESGASGQTAVTEDDVRYFRFPRFDPGKLDKAVEDLSQSLEVVQQLLSAAEQRKSAAWDRFEENLASD